MAGPEGLWCSLSIRALVQFHIATVGGYAHPRVLSLIRGSYVLTSHHSVTMSRLYRKLLLSDIKEGLTYGCGLAIYCGLIASAIYFFGSRSVFVETKLSLLDVLELYAIAGIVGGLIYGLSIPYLTSFLRRLGVAILILFWFYLLVFRVIIPDDERTFTIWFGISFVSAVVFAPLYVFLFSALGGDASRGHAGGHN